MIELNKLYLKLKATHIAILIYFFINKNEVSLNKINYSYRFTFYKYCNELYNMGLLEKENSLKDGRIIVYRLTKNGYNIAKRLYEIYILLKDNNYDERDKS